MDNFNCIFSQPFWLDAVAPERWDAVVVTRGEKTVARMPFVWDHMRGGRIVVMPFLTPVLGPTFKIEADKPASRLAKFKEYANDLINQLPEFIYYQQNFHHSVDNWLPWFWNGYTQTTRYSYILSNLSDMDAIWAGMAENIRREIRKAEKIVQVTEDDDIDTLWELNQKVFQRQGISCAYNRDLLERIDAQCRERGVRKILIARDSNGLPHAGVYLVWDENHAYYLLGGGDPELRTSGATSLCLWTAIKHASQVTKAFDFDGSMIESVEKYFRAFGGTPMPYHSLKKTTLHWRRAELLARFVPKWFRT